MRDKLHKTPYGIADFILPAIILCIGVGWLIWWWWSSTNQKESFQDTSSLSTKSAIADLTGTIGNNSNLIKDNKVNWDTHYEFSYYYIILKIFGKNVLVNSLLNVGKNSGTISAYYNSNYVSLSPQLIEKCIKAGKIKAKHISNLIGFVNVDKYENKSYSYNPWTSGTLAGAIQSETQSTKVTTFEGFYILTDNGSDPDYFIPGDIYVPSNVINDTLTMPKLPFEYYLVYHTSLINSSTKPTVSKKWSDNEKGGNLDVAINCYNNDLFVGFVYNDNIADVINKYHSEFGHIHTNLDKSSVFVNYSQKPEFTFPKTKIDAIVTYDSKKYSYKYFDKNNYLNYNRPFNILNVDEITKLLSALSLNNIPDQDYMGENSNEIQLDNNSDNSGFIQKANVISTKAGIPSNANDTINEAISFGFTRTISLDDVFYVKQIYINNLFASDTTSDIRVGIKNSRNNTIQFVGFADRPVNKQDNYLIAITKKSGPLLVVQDVKTAYGNEIAGDTIIIYSKTKTSTNTTENVIDVCITGYLENEKLDYDQLYAKANNILNPTSTGKSLYTDGEVSQTTTADIPKRITSIILSSYNLTQSTHLQDKPSVTDLVTPNNGAKVLVLFKNNYSNNTFNYPGPVGNMFLYHEKARTLFLPKTVIANKFKIYFDRPGTDTYTWHRSAVQARGYTPTSGDINRFKMEFNVTDIRGSINPESVCPSMDKFMSNQVDAEIILDAMEYNDRINTEQAKLLSQKENLLTLLEQEEDINRLNRVINRLLDVEKQRANETNALNTVKFTNQMKEAMRLKEVLEDRIAQRKKNTLDLNFRINQVVETDELPSTTVATIKETFEDIPVPTNATNTFQPTIEDQMIIKPAC